MNDLADGTYQITAPDFTAGIGVKNGAVIQEAPRIRYLHKASIQYVRQYCERKGWKLERIEDLQGKLI